MLNWEEEVAPALAKVGLAPQPAVQPQKAPQPDQVAICMALVKVSRLSETWGAKAEDSYTDLVAYSALAGQLSTTDPEEFDAY
jgi:hypothetical protein